MLFHFTDDFHLCQFGDPVFFFILEGFQEGDDVVTVCPARIEIELYCSCFPRSLIFEKMGTDNQRHSS